MKNNISSHYKYSRATRERNIIVHCGGEGNEFIRFMVDRGHPNGAEIHVITDTGIIIIYNARTNKLVTKLIARPNQIRRYYGDREEPPTWLMKIAKKNKKMGLNY